MKWAVTGSRRFMEILKWINYRYALYANYFKALKLVVDARHRNTKLETSRPASESEKQHRPKWCVKLSDQPSLTRREGQRQSLLR
jgi:hypothetical protein